MGCEEKVDFLPACVSECKRVGGERVWAAIIIYEKGKKKKRRALSDWLFLLPFSLLLFLFWTSECRFVGGIVAFSFFRISIFDFYMLLFSSQKSLLAFGRFSSPVPEVKKLREVNLSVCVCWSVPRNRWMEGTSTLRMEGKKEEEKEGRVRYLIGCTSACPIYAKKPNTVLTSSSLWRWRAIINERQTWRRQGARVRGRIEFERNAGSFYIHGLACFKKRLAGIVGCELPHLSPPSSSSLTFSPSRTLVYHIAQYHWQSRVW